MMKYAPLVFVSYGLLIGCGGANSYRENRPPPLYSSETAALKQTERKADSPCEARFIIRFPRPTSPDEGKGMLRQLFAESMSAAQAERIEVLPRVQISAEIAAYSFYVPECALLTQVERSLYQAVGSKLLGVEADARMRTMQ